MRDPGGRAAQLWAQNWVLCHIKSMCNNLVRGFKEEIVRGAHCEGDDSGRCGSGVLDAAIQLRWRTAATPPPDVRQRQRFLVSAPRVGAWYQCRGGWRQVQ